MIEGQRAVFTAGVFDMLHYGHVRALKQAKALGKILVVGLLEDKAVARYKEREPLIPYEQRWEVVSELKFVDYIVRQDDTDPTNTLRLLKEEHGWTFEVMCRGDDYKGIPPGTEFIEANGGRVVRLPYCNEVSSTKIKEWMIK